MRRDAFPLSNDTTVAYIESAGGRSRSQLAQATDGADGMTHTMSNKLSLTFEIEYDIAALDPAAWDALPRRSPIGAEYAGTAR